MPRKAATVATMPKPRSTKSPVRVLAHGIESSSVQTLLKIGIEAPISTNSSQMIFFIRWEGSRSLMLRDRFGHRSLGRRARSPVPERVQPVLGFELTKAVSSEKQTPPPVAGHLQLGPLCGGQLEIRCGLEQECSGEAMVPWRLGRGTPAPQEQPFAGAANDALLDGAWNDPTATLFRRHLFRSVKAKRKPNQSSFWRRNG